MGHKALEYIKSGGIDCTGVLGEGLGWLESELKHLTNIKCWLEKRQGEKMEILALE